MPKKQVRNISNKHFSELISDHSLFIAKLITFNVANFSYIKVCESIGVIRNYITVSAKK